jgi:hypothetical protein
MVVRLNPDGCTVNNILDDSAVYAGIRVAKPFVIVTNSRMSFANKVRDLLAQRGIRQEDMADAIGVRQQTVSIPAQDRPLPQGAVRLPRRQRAAGLAAVVKTASGR